MCRIYGHLNGNVTADRLALLPALLRHGGPDGDYQQEGPGWAVGSTRLAVLDPRGGRQPYDLDNRIKVVFNGEIYNHEALRTQLEQCGYRFSDRCDGSILPALYHRYGQSFAEHLDGMYAVAVLDLRQEPTLVLATDDSGMKPLYFHQNNRTGFFFASEIPALRVLAQVGAGQWLEGLDAYLTTKAPFGEQTMFAGIRVLPPAATTVVTADGRMVTRIRQPRPGGAGPRNLAEAAAVTRETLRHETRRLSHSDVPLAAITSGGLDSSLVTVLLAEHVPELHSFHIRYRGNWPSDEAPYARAVANSCRAQLHEVEVDPARLPDLLTEVVARLGQPNADPITVSTLALFRAVREAGFVVALTGDGADEFFGGYSRIKAALADGSDWADRYVAALAAAPRELRWHLYSAEYRAFLRDTGTTEQRLIEALRAAGTDRLRAITDLEVGDRLPAYHLRRVDHLSMASAVEVRLPFCQPAVTALARHLPDDLRVIPGSGKRALYAAAEGLLPRSVLDRPKQPFTLPITAMLTGEPALLTYAREVLATEEVAAGGQLDPRAVGRLLATHTVRPTDTSALAIWSLMIFQIWRRQLRERVEAGCLQTAEVA